MKSKFIYYFFVGCMAALLWSLLMDSLIIVLDRLLVERLKECTEQVNATD